MKVAIVSTFGHYECLFFLCEVLQEHEVTIYIGNNTRGEELSLCKLYSNTKIVRIAEKLTCEIVSLYDVIIKLSSNDDVLYHPNVISLLHLSSLKNTSNRYISISPFVESDNASYMLPVYNPLNVQKCYNKSITFVGYFLNSWVDEDLQYFIENSRHMFQFVVWGDGNYDRLIKYSNVSVYCNTSTEHLNEIINNSSYMLLRNASYINYDRFTGMIALALSFKKPMIVDTKTKEAYGIPGIVYEKRYSELIDTLNVDMSLNVYEKLVDSISEFNKNAINQNKKIMSELCSPKRGLVIACPKEYELICLENMKSLRNNYQCNLPIEIWEIGNEITENTKNKMMQLYHIIFKNVNDYCSNPGHWKGYQVKAFALYHSSFDEAILCDADITFYKSPEMIFNDINYIRTGTYFFRDLDQWVFNNLSYNNDNKFHSLDYFNNRKMFIRDLIPNKSDKFPVEFAYIYEENIPSVNVKEALQEAGVVFMNKKMHIESLNNIFKLNDNHNETYKYVWGDKETFWLGCVMANKEFYFNATAGFVDYSYSTCKHHLTHSYNNEFFWRQR